MLEFFKSPAGQKMFYTLAAAICAGLAVRFPAWSTALAAGSAYLTAAAWHKRPGDVRLEAVKDGPPPPPIQDGDL